MNVFFVFKGSSSNRVQLVTPPLGDGLILPGVVRDSILAMARTWPDVEVVERRITMAEVIESVEKQTLIEMFGCGTACVVSPVGMIEYMGSKVQLPTASSEVSDRVYAALEAITYGKESPHEWCRVVC